MCTVLFVYPRQPSIIEVMGAIPDSHLKKVKKWYYRDLLSMNEIAQKLTVSLDAVVYFMRQHQLNRRTLFQTNKIRFDKKVPTFKVRPVTSSTEELKALGAMLYWGEGYKKIIRNSAVDFANSDPRMISLFLVFLRKLYKLDETRLRIYLYCHANQNVNEIIRFWSTLTNISPTQFTKPYIRKDFREEGREMKYGLVHIRYYDKKLLLEILSQIEYYCAKYAPVV